ncbi:Response regulator receiver domain-containing protein [Collimonas sp. OK607]|uniref:response regulator n=1 Tax=Collimonas sp. OK607 TaxID=1798194 RepID=UPI0008F1E72D|nr:response regulator [Collimonas sp. OK607]SFA76608.1 Response regulator receiver domain-containing protein [Collimonas sp. OK607]
MKNHNAPFAIRFIGFSAREINIFDATFSVEQNREKQYYRLSEDSLQEPDLYLVNADDLKALAILADMEPNNLRPALLVGAPHVELPFATVERPIRWLKLFSALDTLIERRLIMLAKQDSADGALHNSVPERRRRERLDLDLTDPLEYERMRSRAPQSDRILVIDEQSTFRDDLSVAMAHYVVPVEWVGTAEAAAEVYTQLSISVVLINPQLEQFDPYDLCSTIKQQHDNTRVAVIFLIDKDFSYDHVRARQVECDGFLSRHLEQPQILLALGKFLSLRR